MHTYIDISPIFFLSLVSSSSSSSSLLSRCPRRLLLLFRLMITFVFEVGSSLGYSSAHNQNDFSLTECDLVVDDNSNVKIYIEQGWCIRDLGKRRAVVDNGEYVGIEL